jgi:hypothetical protein
VPAVPDYWHSLPRRRFDQRRHGSQFRRLLPAHPVAIAVRQDDDITRRRPVTLAVKCLNPCLSASNHMEEDHALRSGSQNRDRITRRQRVVCPRLAVLTSQENRALQMKPSQRSRKRGCSIRYGGDAVMAQQPTRHDTNRVTHCEPSEGLRQQPKEATNATVHGRT